MTPAWYVETVVAPTVQEFLAKPDDSRLAYLSAIATYHVVDYLMRANVPFGAKRPVRDAEIARIEAVMRASRPIPFGIVESLCHGTKHCGRDRGSNFVPGDEEAIPAFAADAKGAGGDQGRPDRPGLEVMIGQMGWFVDECLLSVLYAYRGAFPGHLGSITIPAYPD